MIELDVSFLLLKQRNKEINQNQNQNQNIRNGSCGSK